MEEILYFRGSYAQYWNVLFAGWQRLGNAYGQEHFKLLAQNLKTPPFEDYVPQASEMVEFTFEADQKRNCDVVTILATQVLDADLVKMEVIIQIEAFEKIGESALSHWKEFKRALISSGLVFDPLAPQINPASLRKPDKPAKPGNGSDLTAWFDWYHKMHEVGYQCTLKQIAEEVGLSPGYVGQLHANYMKERGLKRPNKI